MFNKHKKTAKGQAKDSSNRGKASIFSYYGNRSEGSHKTNVTVRAKSLRRRGLVEHIKHLPVYIATGLIVVSFGYTLTLSSNPKIIISDKTIENHSLVRTPEAYKQEVQKILSRSIFDKSKLTINTKLIEAEIRNKLPEIQTATVSVPILGRRPVVGLVPAEPTLVFESNQGAHIIGGDGRALINLTNLGSNLAVESLLRLKDETPHGSVEQGSQVLPKLHVDFISNVVAQLKINNLAVKSLKLPVLANELHVLVEGKPYYIKFSLVNDPRLQAGSLQALLKHLADKKINPAEYIDVRVEGRAYYK